MPSSHAHQVVTCWLITFICVLLGHLLKLAYVVLLRTVSRLIKSVTGDEYGRTEVYTETSVRGDRR